MAARKKARRRQVHMVDMSVSVKDITRAGTAVDLDVFADGEKLGSIVIGSGSINWRGRNRRSYKRVDWTDFAAMMDKLAYGE